MSLTFMVRFLTLDYYNQPPTKSAIFSYKSGCAEKKVAQEDTPITVSKGYCPLVHEVGAQWPSLCLAVSF